MGGFGKANNKQKIKRSRITPPKEPKIKQAVISYQKGDLHGAKNLLEQVIASNQKDAFAIGVLATVEKALGNESRASDLFEASINIDPNNSAFLHNYSSILSTKDPERALKLSNRAVSITPENTTFLERNGYLRWKAGDLDLALASTLKSLELKPDNPNAHLNLGSIYKDLGNLDLALASTLKSLEFKPDNPDALMNLGGIYKDLGNLDLALASTLKSLEFKPDNPDALMNLGGIYKDLGNLDQALASTLKSLELKPDGRNQPQTGKELADKVLIHKRTNQKAGVRFGEPLKPWINMPASRLECSLALKLFLEFAVHEHRQSQCWLISPREYEKLRGSSAKRRIKATLSDAECLQLFELLEEGWANVARLLRVFGLRMWEVNCLIVRTNADGEAQLFCSQGKVYTTRGVKRSNEPRWLEAVPVAGQTFELVGQIQRCELKLPIGSDGKPIEISGANLGKSLRRLPYWQELVKQKAEQGEWLRPYSFRDTYSLVCESAHVHKADLCAAMGHCEEVHNRSYRTASFRTMRDSFKQAFD